MKKRKLNSKNPKYMKKVDEGGMTEMSKRIEFADKMAQYVAYQKDKTGRKSDSWYDKTERKLKQQGFDKLYPWTTL